MILETFHAHLQRSYVRDLSLLFIYKDPVYKHFSEMQMQQATKEEAALKIANYCIPCIMMFVVFVAKLSDLFLVPDYHFMGERSFVTAYITKMISYPLFFDKSYGVNPTKMALKYLHSDFIKVLKHLKVSVEMRLLFFNDLESLKELIDVVYARILKIEGVTKS